MGCVKRVLARWSKDSEAIAMCYQALIHVKVDEREEKVSMLTGSAEDYTVRGASLGGLYTALHIPQLDAYLMSG